MSVFASEVTEHMQSTTPAGNRFTEFGSTDAHLSWTDVEDPVAFAEKAERVRQEMVKALSEKFDGMPINRWRAGQIILHVRTRVTAECPHCACQEVRR